MGWSGGSEILSNVITAIKDHLSDECKLKVYRQLIEAFQKHDCDTLHECQGLDSMFDLALEEAGELDIEDDDETESDEQDSRDTFWGDVYEMDQLIEDRDRDD